MPVTMCYWFGGITYVTDIVGHISFCCRFVRDRPLALPSTNHSSNFNHSGYDTPLALPAPDVSYSYQGAAMRPAPPGGHGIPVMSHYATGFGMPVSGNQPPAPPRPPPRRGMPAGLAPPPTFVPAYPPPQPPGLLATGPQVG
eukprot:jgi/Chrzof1/4242/Cz14g04160.t1